MTTSVVSVLACLLAMAGAADVAGLAIPASGTKLLRGAQESSKSPSMADMGSSAMDKDEMPLAEHVDMENEDKFEQEDKHGGSPRSLAFCTSADLDPWSSGNLVACCEGLERVLEGRAYVCRARTSAPTVSTALPVEQSGCTPEGSDPYSSGGFVACCENFDKILFGRSYKCAARAPPGSGGALTLQVMSYNTEYVGYPNRVWQYGEKIREVNAAVVGTQECQNAEGLARASGYKYVPNTRGNAILYNSEKVTLVEGSGGQMWVTSDKYARRSVTWAKFQVDDTTFWHFNTHLPHNHGAAASKNTHARIAQAFLRKRRELGAGTTATVVTGDMNTFASRGAPEGSFESNLIDAGFELSYQARGNPGYGGLDQIFASHHWISSNGADRGTGGSDHPAIVVDVTLQRVSGR